MRNVIGEQEKLLHMAFDHLSEKYPSELYEWLRIHEPDVYHELFDLEDRLNANLGSDGSIMELEAILGAYREIDTNLKKTFNERGNPKVR